MPALIDIKGKKFNRLKAISFLNKDTRGNHRWIFRCDCGKEIVTTKHNVKAGKSKSCGCLSVELAIKRQTTHGLSKHRLFRTWSCMINRVCSKKDIGYKIYGARGIKVCDSWYSVANFISDMDSTYKKGLTLERLDNNGNYCKENCKWVTAKEQARNRRSNVIYKGEVAKDASIRLGGSSSLVSRRIKSGWDVDRAFTEPVRI